MLLITFHKEYKRILTKYTYFCFHIIQKIFQIKEVKTYFHQYYSNQERWGQLTILPLQIFDRINPNLILVFLISSLQIIWYYYYWFLCYLSYLLSYFLNQFAILLLNLNLLLQSFHYQ